MERDAPSSRVANQSKITLTTTERRAPKASTASSRSLQQSWVSFNDACRTRSRLTKSSRTRDAFARQARGVRYPDLSPRAQCSRASVNAHSTARFEFIVRPSFSTRRRSQHRGVRTWSSIVLREQRLYTSPVSMAEVEKLALDLPERERASLAANLIQSLPPFLSDADEGTAEALRRDAELEAGTSEPLSLGELDAEIRKRRS